MKKNRKALKYLFSKTDEQIVNKLNVHEVVNQNNVNNIINRSIEEQEKILLEAISNLHKNFEYTKDSRRHLIKEQYINLIQNLDLVQSEDFFLKGHLLLIKNKFFINNKKACQNIGNNLIKTAKQLQEHNIKLTVEG